MVTALVGAAILWRGTALAPVLAVLLVPRFPVLALVVGVASVVVHRRSTDPAPSVDDEAWVLERLAARMAGGDSPRAALVGVSGGSAVDLTVPVRMAQLGEPLERIAEPLGAALPHNGSLLAAAWVLSGETGAPAASIMRMLAGRAAERGRLERERRSLTAQARATAWLIAGLPAALLLFMAVTGRLGPGPGAAVVLVGVVLQALGLAVVAMLIRGAR